MRLSKRIRIAGSIVGLVVAAAAVAMLFYIGPGNVWGMLRYDQRRKGDLVVGHTAPDFMLTALDGVSRVPLLQPTGQRPMLLVFGSFT